MSNLSSTHGCDPWVLEEEVESFEVLLAAPILLLPLPIVWARGILRLTVSESSSDKLTVGGVESVPEKRFPSFTSVGFSITFSLSYRKYKCIGINRYKHVGNGVKPT